MLNSGVYLIEHTESGKVYVGSTTNIKHRLWTHRATLRRGNHTNPYLQHAWDKYGAPAFEMYLVEYSEKDRLQEREQFWMDLFEGNYYNAIPFADRRELSKEHRRKLSLAAIGKPHPVSQSEEARKRRSEAQLGKVLSREHRAAISRGVRDVSEDTKERILAGLEVGWGNTSSRKLTPQQIYSIRDRLKDGDSYVHIAKDFDVARETIARIDRGDTYADI